MTRRKSLLLAFAAVAAAVSAVYASAYAWLAGEDDRADRPITGLRFAGRELRVCDRRPGNGAAPRPRDRLRDHGRSRQRALH